MKKLTLWYPVKPWLPSQFFGGNGEYYRANGIDIIGHNGIDIPCADGALVRAAHDGEVVFTGEDGKGGLGVVLRTLAPFAYGTDEAFFKTIYWHLKKDTFIVRSGQKVSAGDALAAADNTGLSTGTHLHFGLKPVARGEETWAWYNLEQNNGYLGATDPTPFFSGYYAADAKTVLWITQQLITLYKKLLNVVRSTYHAAAV